MDAGCSPSSSSSSSILDECISPSLNRTRWWSEHSLNELFAHVRYKTLSLVSSSNCNTIISSPSYSSSAIRPFRLSSPFHSSWFMLHYFASSSSSLLGCCCLINKSCIAQSSSRSGRTRRKCREGLHRHLLLVAVRNTFTRGALFISGRQLYSVWPFIEPLSIASVGVVARKRNGGRGRGSALENCFIR